MPLINSITGKIRKTYSIKKLTKIANYLRGIDLVANDILPDASVGVSSPQF